MHGHELLESLHALRAAGVVGAVLRHAERHPILDAADPTLAEITPAGAVSAEAFGRRIEGFDTVRLFHSPIKRCGQTAECIARGAASRGLAVELVGPQAALGVTDFVLDPREAGRLTVLHGNHFVRLWVAGEIPSSVIRAAAHLVGRKVAYLAERLGEPGGGRRLDLHVSHDWNILVLRELFLSVRHEDAGWLNFLDGIAFSIGVGGLRAIYRQHAVTRPLPWVVAQPG